MLVAAVLLSSPIHDVEVNVVRTSIHHALALVPEA